ncbi:MULTISPECIES: DUF4262 domain-containing protein [unclassified Streptomyces]|uniref:DUF4262 domain-containing protein n=1 Tax=unclassified Streptomyces TaxID=2593676 RepID=UPI00331D4C65
MLTDCDTARARNIDRGFTLARAVFEPARGGRPPLAYTVGLPTPAGRSRFELVTCGLLVAFSRRVLTRAARQLKEDALDPARGLELDRVIEENRVRLHRVQNTTHFTGVAPTVAFWQVLLPDGWGRFPGDLHYGDWPGQPPQPLL